MASGNFRNQAHEEQVVVICQIRFLKYRGKLELIGSNFVVACLSRDSESVTFDFEIKHKSLDPRRDRAEIMVFELLVFS